MRTDEEIMAELDKRFFGHGTVRSVPIHLASPPPAGQLEPKTSLSIGKIERKTYANGNGVGAKLTGAAGKRKKAVKA